MIGAYKPARKPDTRHLNTRLHRAIDDDWYTRPPIYTFTHSGVLHSAYEPIFLIESQLKDDFYIQKGIYMKSILQKVAIATIAVVAVVAVYLKVFEYFTGTEFTLSTNRQVSAPADYNGEPPRMPTDTLAEDFRALIMALRDANKMYQDDSLGGVVSRQSAQSAVETATVKLRGVPMEFTPGASDSWYYSFVVERRVAVFIIQKGKALTLYLADMDKDTGHPNEDNTVEVDNIADAVTTLKKMLDSQSGI